MVSQHRKLHLLGNRDPRDVVFRQQLPILTSLAVVSLQAAEVEIEDVSRAYTLFIDVKRSTEFLVAHESDYMFNQVCKHVAACTLPPPMKINMTPCVRHSAGSLGMTIM